MKIVDLIADYHTSPADLILTVEFGDAQIGASVVKLSGTERGTGEITDLKIGSKQAVVGKKVTVKSVVTDVNDKTNRTSVTYTLRSGKLKQVFVSSGTVDVNGDSIIYRALFNMK